MRQTDEAAIEYLIQYGNELDLLAGTDCVIFLQVESFVTPNPFSPLRFMPDLIEEVREGYSLETARYFEIDPDVLPCLVLFRELLSTEYILVTFQDMVAQAIAVQMRTLLSTIRRAINHKKNLLDVLEDQRITSKFQSAGRTIVGRIESIPNKTFQSAVENIFKIR